MESHGVRQEVPETHQVGLIRGVLSRKWGVRLIVLAIATFWLVLIAVSWAEAEASTDIPSNGSSVAGREPASSGGDASEDAPRDSDEYSFKWLDPDKKIYVLQNRRYLKAERPMLSVLAGPGISNPYRNTSMVSPRLAYFFTEWLGLEAFYTKGFNSENGTFDALKRNSPNSLPVVREIRSQTGLLAEFVPFYAKINVFNKILYFDWYFNAGAGVMQTALDTRTSSSSPASFQDQSFTGYYLGTGHLFHLSQLLTLRLDFSGAFYRAGAFGNSGDQTWFSNYLFGFGLGLRI